MKRFVLLLGLIAGGWLAVAATEAATLQARLIRAGGQNATTDQPLADIAGKLRAQFGYEHYRQLGQQQQALPAPGQMVRLNLGQGFTLFVTTIKADPGQPPTVKLEWYAGKAILVNSTVQLSPGSHLLVKGPDVARSTILLAVSLKP